MHRPSDSSQLDFANWKERQPLAKALRPIYAAPHAEAALVALDTFATSPWGIRFPTVVASWRRAWTHVIPFFAFPPDVRRVIYTTDEIDKYFFTHSIFLGRSPPASRYTAAEQAPHQERGPRRRPVDGARGAVIRRSRRDVVTAGAPASGPRVSRTRALPVRRWRVRDRAVA